MKLDIGTIKLKDNVPMILVKVDAAGKERWQNLYMHWSKKLHIQCPECASVFPMSKALKKGTS